MHRGRFPLDDEGAIASPRRNTVSSSGNAKSSSGASFKVIKPCSACMHMPQCKAISNRPTFKSLKSPSEKNNFKFSQGRPSHLLSSLFKGCNQKTKVHQARASILKSRLDFAPVCTRILLRSGHNMGLLEPRHLWKP